MGKLWRYRVSVSVDVLGSFEREHLAENAQQAAAIVVAAMGDQGPWGGPTMPLDMYLNGADIKVRVTCLQLRESMEPLTLPDLTKWTLYTPDGAKVESGGSYTAHEVVTPREINPTQVEIAPERPEVSKPGGGELVARMSEIASEALIAPMADESYQEMDRLRRALRAIAVAPAVAAASPEVSKAGGRMFSDEHHQAVAAGRCTVPDCGNKPAHGWLVCAQHGGAEVEKRARREPEPCAQIAVEPNGTIRPLVERIADELSWWLNWFPRGHESEAFPARTFRSAQLAGRKLLEELDPRRVGKDRE